MGARRLCALVRGLPPGSAVHRALDPKGWSWTEQTELLAYAVEELDLANRMYAAVHVKDGDGRTGDPVRVPRPYDTHAPDEEVGDVHTLMAQAEDLGGAVVRKGN